MDYVDLECVEKSHSPAGTVNRIHEYMDKKHINMDKNHQIYNLHKHGHIITHGKYVCMYVYYVGCRVYPLFNIHRRYG